MKQNKLISKSIPFLKFIFLRPQPAKFSVRQRVEFLIRRCNTSIRSSRCYRDAIRWRNTCIWCRAPVLQRLQREFAATDHFSRSVLLVKNGWPEVTERFFAPAPATLLIVPGSAWPCMGHTKARPPRDSRDYQDQCQPRDKPYMAPYRNKYFYEVSYSSLSRHNRTPFSDHTGLAGRVVEPES